MQRVGLCIKTLKKFSTIFNTYKNNLGRFFKNREPKLWNFHPNMVFERFNAFLERLRTIQWFFNTVLEFSKLEKVEIGGIKGRNLSARVTVVFTEFQQCFSIFSGKSYDVLDPDDSSFISDFENFKKKIFEMDMKLAAILCQAFEDCSNLESIFKV
jgi:dynein heavy chain